MVESDVAKDDVQNTSKGKAIVLDDVEIARRNES